MRRMNRALETNHCHVHPNLSANPERQLIWVVSAGEEGVKRCRPVDFPLPFSPKAYIDTLLGLLLTGYCHFRCHTSRCSVEGFQSHSISHQGKGVHLCPHQRVVKWHHWPAIVQEERLTLKNKKYCVSDEEPGPRQLQVVSRETVLLQETEREICILQSCHRLRKNIAADLLSWYHWPKAPTLTKVYKFFPHSKDV